MPNAEYITSGTTPQKSDTRRLLLVKMVGATVAGGVGGNSGTGSPEGVVSASPGAMYLDTSSDSLWAKKTGTGSTGWIELIA